LRGQHLLGWVLRFFRDVQIADRQNVDIQSVDITN
jgi:hypothetical protein